MAREPRESWVFHGGPYDGLRLILPRDNDTEPPYEIILRESLVAPLRDAVYRIDFIGANDLTYNNIFVTAYRYDHLGRTRLQEMHDFWRAECDKKDAEIRRLKERLATKAKKRS